MEWQDLLTGTRLLADTHALVAIGLLLVVGYVLGKLSGRVRLPEITGFIIAGLVIGPGGLDMMPHLLEPVFMVLSQAALILIAFTIGAEFYWPKMRRIGGQVLVMGLLEVVASFALVSLVMRGLGLPWPFAFLLGAIAAATAPAATVAIVQSLRARGRYVDMLYGLVALDDAGAVILFAVVFALAGSFLVTGVEISSGTLILHALWDVVISLGGGLVIGLIIYRVSRRFPNSNEAFIASLGLLFLLAGLTQGFGYSLLLSGMAAGAAYVNCVGGDQRLFHRIAPITPPLYALFFVIAGAELQPAILLRPETLLLGSAYVLFRGLGKYGGVYWGGAWSGVDDRIRTYLGLSMIPQAGVALGLVLLIRSSPLLDALSPEQLTHIASLINVVLFSVLFSELVGPPLSRYAIIRGNNMEDLWTS